VPRLRVTLSGGVFRPWMKYSFQFDFSRTPGEGASKIKDAILEIRPVGKTYRIQAGQFKVPFGLQQITSSGRLQFVDRAITDAKFNPARDMGVMWSGTSAARKFGYDAGVFNGSGESLRQNNRSHLWAVRGYLNPLGAYSPSESATDAGDKGVLHLGALCSRRQADSWPDGDGCVRQPDNQIATTSNSR
jgi:phosphate-selective porin OprO/OprP